MCITTTSWIEWTSVFSIFFSFSLFLLACIAIELQLVGFGQWWSKVPIQDTNHNDHGVSSFVFISKSNRIKECLSLDFFLSIRISMISYIIVTLSHCDREKNENPQASKWKWFMPVEAFNKRFISSFSFPNRNRLSWIHSMQTFINENSLRITCFQWLYFGLLTLGTVSASESFCFIISLLALFSIYKLMWNQTANGHAILANFLLSFVTIQRGEIFKVVLIVFISALSIPERSALFQFVYSLNKINGFFLEKGNRSQNSLETGLNSGGWKFCRIKRNSSIRLGRCFSLSRRQ